jgi:nucleoside phosphorylase
VEAAESVLFLVWVQLEDRSMNTNESHKIDICILCALPEEAKRLREAFQGASESVFKDQPPVEFVRKSNANLKREYDYAVITNRIGEKLSVVVIWLADNGPMETGLQAQKLFEEFKPRFAAMTGICAGDREKVKLGDIIVASRAYLYDVGKIVEGKDGRPELHPDTPMWSLPTEVLQAARGFDAWNDVVAKEPRPLSLCQQRDWLLDTLLDTTALKVDNIPLQERTEHAPHWKRIIRELRKGDEKAFLTDERALKDYERVLDLRYEEDFPFKDPKEPKVYIEPMASGSTVRADNPFDGIHVSVRGTLAVEMEGAAFYRTFKEFDNIHYLLVKGVCDYADKEKDDSYHDYAGTVSALYLYAFLRYYVTSERFPGVGKAINGISSSSVNIQVSGVSSTMADATPPTEEPQNGLNLFYSYDPEDEEYRKKLDKSLVLLTARRGGPLRELYANNINAGLSKDAAAFLEQAQIILLLISPDFMANDDLYEKHLKRAFELQKEGRARIIPILLRSTVLHGTSLSDVVVLPRNGVPISEWKNKDSAYTEISTEIRKIVQEMIVAQKR